MRDRVGKRGSSRTLCGLAGSEKRRTYALDHMHVDASRNVGKARDRIATPIGARDRRVVERYGFVERPARGLYDTAFDLIANTVGIDGLAAIDRGDCAQDFYASRFAFDLDVDRHREIGAEVLVARKRKPTAPSF